jgi:hypothetical protein
MAKPRLLPCPAWQTRPNPSRPCPSTHRHQHLLIRHHRHRLIHHRRYNRLRHRLHLWAHVRFRHMTTSPLTRHLRPCNRARCRHYRPNRLIIRHPRPKTTPLAIQVTLHHYPSKSKKPQSWGFSHFYDIARVIQSCESQIPQCHWAYPRALCLFCVVQ